MLDRFRLLFSSMLVCAAVLVATPVLADTSVAAGYFVPTPAQQKSLGILATTGLSLPVVPIAPQVTVAVPFSGGRYVISGEARVGNPSAYVGAGAGFGRLNSTGNTGALYDVFVGKRIAPLTTIEARYYGFGGSNAGSTGFIGIRVAI